METGATIIFGAGAMGKTLFPQIKAIHGAKKLLFADSNPNLWGTSLLDTPIISPEEMSQMKYDRIIVASLSGFETIPAKLISAFAVPNEKIDLSFVQEIYERTYNTRNRFLKQFAGIAHTKRIDGTVAEGGVFEGYFAKRINYAFPEKTLYLFDTFEGFDERDIAVEQGDTRNRAKHFNVAMTLETLLSSMPYPKRVVIKKGYFPETAIDVTGSFAFINLDFDLYQPTLAGLEFFYPKMVPGGVILVHDYFHDSVVPNKDLAFQGARQAVDEFSAKHGVMFMPIGDEMSIAIVKS